MTQRKDALKDRLSRYREINIMVTGRNSGRAISIPVWFVFEDEKLYLLPGHGSDTQWYKNVLKNPAMRIDTRGAETELNAVPLTDRRQLSSIIGKFQAKYRAEGIRLYSKLDVAVVGEPC